MWSERNIYGVRKDVEQEGKTSVSCARSGYHVCVCMCVCGGEYELFIGMIFIVAALSFSLSTLHLCFYLQRHVSQTSKSRKYLKKGSFHSFANSGYC